ncbi:regulatory protein, Fis family [Pedobacter steynii]|uniref:Regulatory protein, Fis family n=1 Tax=Pedobacter steynii TaxID=430522 RepID=A0A1G9UYC4_9SPHI|nr:sigma 54-interacting response regulator [Pedobacter steynii]NQX40918.1 sigma 54-interacting transcriptional regulator [Pedobacter steynii]SDM64863.1 regulatory protein, Fis family [Pedobacter steynii]
MKEKILIVEDEFIVANDLSLMLKKAGYDSCGIAPSVARALELIAEQRPDWVLIDILLQGERTGIDLGIQLSDRNIPFIYISANTNQTILQAAKATLPYGFLVKPFREKDLLVMLDIAQYRHGQNIKYNLRHQTGLLQQLATISTKNEASAEKVKQIAQLLQPVLPFDQLFLTRMNPRSPSRDCSVIKSTSGNYQLESTESMLILLSVSNRDYKLWNPLGLKLDKQLYCAYEFRKLRMEDRWTQVVSDKFGLESAIVSTITTPNGDIYRAVFFSTEGELYNSIHVDLANQIMTSFGPMIDEVFFSKPVAEIKETKTDPSPPSHFHGIIGSSPLLNSVFDKVKIVAADDTSVLILGESGTGKERIAQILHELSSRKSKKMVTVNCAALPLTLIESTLFGHEKGAFTGAGDRRIGKFEQADGGTIFLDEIGELPLEAQVKLLRVLQEKEIERLGGNQTRKINVRIITATNRNLEKEVAEGRFRLDLYYRLNVFPIELPPLRQRKEDIEALACHFVKKYSSKSERPVKSISAIALQQLTSYDWPGNIRELEHLIERAVLLSSGTEITDTGLASEKQTENPVGGKPHRTGNPDAIGNQHPAGKTKTLEEVEKGYILEILHLCKGKISGPGGAAELLNIPSTTLNSKIKKLGISYEFTD